MSQMDIGRLPIQGGIVQVAAGRQPVKDLCSSNRQEKGK